MSPRHPLVTVSELAARLGDPTLRIADCRWYLERPGGGREAYDAGHIPGATFIDVDGVLTAPEGPGRHPLPDAAVFTERLGAMGIGNEHVVVAYDDVGGWVAARLWWMLDDLGHERVAVLDGGIGAWIAVGGEITSAVPSWPPARLELADRWTRTIERDAMRARLGRLRLLDARGGPRYRGEVEPVDPVPGHIPTALSAPTDGNLDADGTFLPPTDLAARFASLGADGSAGVEVVTSCGSGVAACHNALAMRVAGLPDPLLYPGSYSDWSRSDYPIATGEEPGAPV